MGWTQSGTYLHTAGNPDKCIDVPGDKLQSGNQLWLWDCSASRLYSGQSWDYGGGSSGDWSLYLGFSASDASMCMDLKGGSTDNGTPVEIWQCNRTPNQNWCPSAWAGKSPSN